MLKLLPASIALAALLCAGVALAADPTPNQIYDAARSGQIASAEQMVTQVLRDHPRSGKAHYVAAEVYARAGDYRTARSELATAARLEPGLPFANPASVRELRAQLGQAPLGYRVAVPAQRRSVAWLPLLLVVGVIVVVWALVSRRRAAYGYGAGYPPGAVPPGAPGPYGPYGGAPGVGTGLMGALGTGLAVGAGAAAGEELVHHVLDRPGAAPSPGEEGAPNGDMGGNDFGLTGGDAGSWDDGSSLGGGSDGGGDWT